MDAADPLPTPVQVIFSRLLIVVDIVLIANIERRIGKHQINRTLLQLGQLLDTVALVDLVFL